ncbi:M56 family metallopeptidase [Zongyangia hominis]|uniref:PASTA domain-containing protein n=1 Tax=Zongyangia hominis TaxID=2763677 RepID=A0A926IA00_9FIRM|nr:M56 family metallopeptidase [Zongyangia hominis]MBC8569701.1 PASTA domain-containing protein [Zongyangia hominis]
MERLFFMILNMSITASVAIVLVMLLRLLLKKRAPKWLTFAVWGIVLARLLLPFSVASPVSIFNVMPQTQRTEIIAPQAGGVSRMEFIYHPQVPSEGEGNLSGAPSGGQTNQTPPAKTPSGDTPAPSETRKFSWSLAAAIFWLSGVGLMLCMSLIFFVRIKLRLRTAVALRNRAIVKECVRIVGIRRKVQVYQSNLFTTPVVSGIIRPKIILPDYLNLENEAVLRYILIHELVHIRRQDMLTKLLSLLAATIHWFNPLVWVAFFLSGKDMESACDERVLSFAPEDIRTDYARSLLAMAIRQQNLPLAAGMVAFGESNVRTRIRDIMKYQKRTAVAVALAALILVASSCTLLSNAKPQEAPVSTPPAVTPVESGSSQSTSQPEGNQPEVKQEDYTPYLKEYVLYLDAGGNMGLFSSPEEISPDSYFVYAVGRLYNYFIDKRNFAEIYGEEFARKEIPASYQDEQYGYIYPQEEIEKAVMEHFDVSVEYLRSASSYLPERQGYAFLAGPGFGEQTEPIVTGVEKDGNLLHITYQVMTVAATYEVYDENGVHEEDEPARYLGSKTLTVQLTDGGFRYLSLQTSPPDVSAISSQLLQNYAARYEVAAHGDAFSSGESINLKSAYFYAVDKLLANGAAKEYAAYSDEVSADGYPLWLKCDIPAQRVYETAFEDFGVPVEAWAEGNFAANFVSYDPQTDTFAVLDSQPMTTDDTFVLEDAKDLGEGRIELIVSRKRGETTIDSHIYTFEVTTEEPGEEDSSPYAKVTAKFISCEDTRDISDMAVVPEVTGMPYQQAISVLYNAGFHCQPVPLGESWRLQGYVARMDPPAGSEKSRLTTVVQLYCEQRES